MARYRTNLDQMILFGCQDVGPAKYLSELTSSFSSQSLSITSSLSRPFFNTLREIRVKEIKKSKQLRLVVVGTSLGEEKESLEKRIIKEAKRLNIPSVAIIEHWSWYSKRFETTVGSVMPDFIILNDCYAEMEAIEEGLPKSRLKPLGNPYLERLSQSNFDSCVNCSEAKRKYGLPENKRIVVFVSEELRDTFKNGTKDYLGYDEYKALNELKSILLPSDHLVIKSHPEEIMHKYDSYLDESTSLIGNCSLQTLLSLADVVVGMASMLLLELALFRGNVISFRPNARKDFIGERLGATIPAKNTEQLARAMNGSTKSDSQFGNRFNGSKNRITSFLKEVCK